MNDPCPTAWTADIRCDEKCPGGAALDGTHSMDNATGWPRGVCKWCKEGSGWDKDAATCRVCKSDETVLEGLCCKEGEWVRDGACFSCPAGEKWTHCVYGGGCMPMQQALNCEQEAALARGFGWALTFLIWALIIGPVCCCLARCFCPGRQADLIAAVKRRCGCSGPYLETLCCCANVREADTGVAAKSSSAPPSTYDPEQGPAVVPARVQGAEQSTANSTKESSRNPEFEGYE